MVIHAVETGIASSAMSGLGGLNKRTVEAI